MTKWHKESHKVLSELKKAEGGGETEKNRIEVETDRKE